MFELWDKIIQFSPIFQPAISIMDHVVGWINDLGMYFISNIDYKIMECVY